MTKGKFLRKAICLLLAVVMLVSLCAVCFSTIGSAYTASDDSHLNAGEVSTRYTYEFETGKGYSYGVDHNAVSWSGNGGNTNYNNTSGKTSMGLLVGATTSASDAYGWFHKMKVRHGNVALGSAADNGVKLEAGTTYRFTVKYMPLLTTGYKWIRLGFGLIASDNKVKSLHIDQTNMFYANSCAAGNATAPNVAKASTFDTDGNTFKTAAQTYLETNGWQTETILYTATEDDITNGAELVITYAAQSGVTFYQFIVNSVTIDVLTDPTGTVVSTADFVEGGESTSFAKSTDGKIVLPEPVKDTNKFDYWTDGTNNYFPGEEVTLTADATTFTAVYSDTVARVIFNNTDGTVTNELIPVNGALVPDGLNADGFASYGWYTASGTRVHTIGTDSIELFSQYPADTVTDIYTTPVVDAKSSLRKAATGVSAGLRFRGELEGSLVTGADEIGFVAIPYSKITTATADTWYKLDGAAMTENSASLASGAAYVKIANFTDTTGYYAMNGSNYQYQLCITGLDTDSKKATEFVAVMYVKTGNTFTYKYVNSVSYNAVKVVYEANNITGY